MLPRPTIPRLSRPLFLAVVALLALSGAAQASVQPWSGELHAEAGQAGGDCEFVAAIAPGPGDAGTTSITAAVGEEITFWGSFVPETLVELTYVHEGVPFGDFTPSTADAAGDILFVHEFTADQVGSWTVTAAVPATECAGTVEVTVIGVSDTAAAEQSAESPVLTLGVVLLLAAALVIVRRRERDS
jgi:hypothetical protein